MKKLSLLIVLALSLQAAHSQVEVSWDASGTKILKGFIQKKDLVTDTAFTWYAPNAKGYTPEAGALAAFKNNHAGIHILVFGGTWCSDTQGLLPKFYSLIEAAGFPENKVTLIGVDRDKKALHHLSEAFQVLNVPTFIVLKNGKEIGRVVEYGKYGMFDKELGEIVAQSAK